jgi:serine/threonine protein phosphatase 1
MKIHAFGDIHAQYFKLKRLVDRLFIKKDDVLVFLGDYVDRGKYAFETIEYLLKLKEKYNCVFLKGNHEAMMMDYLSGIHERLWIQNGGVATTDSYYNNGWRMGRNRHYLRRELPRSHIDFLQNLKLYHETEDYIFVHAAVWPQDPLDLENQPEEVLLWERSTFIGTHFDFGKKIIFGHTSFEKPFVTDTKIGIDTGACYDPAYGGGNLTCITLPDETFMSQGAVLEELEALDD